MQEEIFHIRGLSSDGLVGLSLISVQREMIGRGLAMQDRGARGIGNDARPLGIIKHPGKFRDDDARKKFRESFQEAQTGANAGKTAVFEDGMTYESIGISNVDAQFIESSRLNREEIAGIFRVPPHKIGMLERSTNNNIEHQGIEFVTDCMQPIASRWEARINSDLIEPLEIDAGDGIEYFVKFRLDGLLRGALKDRYDAYAVGRNWGWLSPNDVCRLENRNPISADDGGDDYLRPVNMAIAGAPQQGLPAAPGPSVPGQQDAPPDNSDSADPTPDAPAAQKLLHSFACEAARRVVRKEVTALRREIGKAFTAGAGVEFDRAAKAFYADHVALISQTMCISIEAAQAYGNKNLGILSATENLHEKQTAIDWIEDSGPDELAEIALGERIGAKGTFR